MTLSVNLFFRDSTTHEIVRVEDPDESPDSPGNPTLGGFEIWRKELWGSEWAVQHGAVYLPQLAQTDLYVEHSELKEFHKECLYFFEHCSELAAATQQLSGEATIKARLANYINAIDQAMAKGCGVLIW